MIAAYRESSLSTASPNPGSSSTVGDAAPSQIILTGLAELPVEAMVSSVGVGRPFVFLHGLVGLSEHWDAVVERVCHRFRCVLLDLPLLELRRADCSIEGVAELTTRFLESAIDGPAVLVGSSFGGHVSLRIAMERPELVDALVLTGSSGIGERPMDTGNKFRRNKEWIVERIAELYHDRSNMNADDVDRGVSLLSDPRRGKRMVRLSNSALKNDLRHELHRIAAPTLLIWGREDVITPPEAAIGIADKISDSRLVWFDGCGHVPMIEHPGPFADALLVFADELDRRDARARGSDRG